MSDVRSGGAGDEAGVARLSAEPATVRTLALTLAYDGTGFAGWQRQVNGVSIQGLVEQALAAFTPHAPAPVVIGASRTDAGVHALGQVASVRVAFGHRLDAVQRALNIALPPAVRVLHLVEAAESFHARHDARGKLYRYRIYRDPVLHPMARWFVWHVPGRLDIAAMREAASRLVGEHDFASFQASGSAVIDTRRTIGRVDIVDRGDEWHVEVEGSGFLRHMVRIITGSLVDVGRGTYDPAWLGEVLETRDRRRAGRTAPASGLCLERVFYDAHPAKMAR